jgi:hypothetical protein
MNDALSQYEYCTQEPNSRNEKKPLSTFWLSDAEFIILKNTKTMDNLIGIVFNNLSKNLQFFVSGRIFKLQQQNPQNASLSYDTPVLRNPCPS